MTDWIKWKTTFPRGPVMPLGTLVDVIFRNGTAQSAVPYCNMDWTHRDDFDTTSARDIVSYRISNGQPDIVQVTPHEFIRVTPPQITPAIEQKPSDIDANDGWMTWDLSQLPTKPTGSYTMEWRLASGLVCNGAASDPNWSIDVDVPYRVVAYRWTDSRVMVQHPVTGKWRHPVDIMQDPEGVGVAHATALDFGYDKSKVKVVPPPSDIEVLRAFANGLCIQNDEHATDMHRSILLGIADRMELTAHVANKLTPKSMTYDETTIDAQFAGLLGDVDGRFATEDLAAVRAALRNLNLTEGTVHRVVMKLMSKNIAEPVPPKGRRFVTWVLPEDVLDTMQARAHALKQSIHEVIAGVLQRDIDCLAAINNKIEAAVFESRTYQYGLIAADGRRFTVTLPEEDSTFLVRWGSGVSAVKKLEELGYESNELSTWTKTHDPDADDYETIDGQFSDLLEGLGASEDIADIRKALTSVGIADGTVTKLLQTLSNGRTNLSANATLSAMGYMDNGGEHWKPPIGAPKKMLAAGEHLIEDKLLHVLRNPYGWSDHSVATVRQRAADLIERRAAESKRLREKLAELKRVINSEYGTFGASTGLSRAISGIDVQQDGSTPFMIYVNSRRGGKTTAQNEWIKKHGWAPLYEADLAARVTKTASDGLRERMRKLHEYNAADIFAMPYGKPQPKHTHYFKDVSGLDRIDVYRIIDLYKITDPCIQHALKKLLVAGGRGAGKDISKDMQEVIDSCVRWQEMQKENGNVQ